MRIQQVIKMSALLFFLLFCCFSCSYGAQVTYDNRALKIDGQRKIIISGSIHYPRSTPEMWPSLIKKSKEGGLNTIDVYVFWNAHEPLRRQYDFSGNLDLIKFLKIIQDEDMYVIFRIGPYVCAEWNYGGFPVWLHNEPNMSAFRTMNDQYLAEMKIFTKLIVDKTREAKLFASQGGPIILAQIENEYGNVIQNYGEAGKKYVEWCGDFAQSLDVGVPWIMCQQDDNAPPSIINTCNGFYCDQFVPKNPNIPKMWTENWTGWFQNWGGATPYRPVEDIAFAVGRFFQLGGTLQNYYMYHGGTNFGRTSGGPYITTTYDYDAPLDEYGNLNQPKYGHLKQLHDVIMSLEQILTYGNRRDQNYDSVTSVTKYEYNGESVCFFGSSHNFGGQTLTFEGKNYTIAPWTLSIYKNNCTTEVFNTGRVNTQTNVMTPKVENGTKKLEWKWMAEHFEHFKPDQNHHSTNGVTYANVLNEQKHVTNDQSDYLWYMGSVDIDGKDTFRGDDLMLQVHTKAHVLHAFVNGKHIGSQWAKGGKFEFVFQDYTQLNIGKNTISLLSATVGLQHYGPHFDQTDNGILGPVRLVAPNSETKDISNIQWGYKVGLNGMDHLKLYAADSISPQIWHTANVPINRMFVWYKTSFETPSGEDAVVLDLQGLGKGVAWVNGHNIGRYWPSFISGKDGCSECNFRGKYSETKCLRRCGEPSQRNYHVPREFLNSEGDNVLVLFEEFGGNPFEISVKTVKLDKVCFSGDEGGSLELSCNGFGKISSIEFGSFGNPTGSCGAFKKGDVDAFDSLSVIQQACVGKESCRIDVSDKTFKIGSKTSKDEVRKIAVEALCSRC